MIKFGCKFFDDLTLRELYGLMRLRQEIFVVEQDCVYLDADGKDLQAHHVVGTHPEHGVVAHSRLLAPGDLASNLATPRSSAFRDASSIGRIVVSQKVRGTGVGRELMMQSLTFIGELYPDWPCKISAQTYLRDFYESFGFTGFDEEYLEDGIPHRSMRREAIP